MGVFNFAGVKVVEAPAGEVPKCPKCEQNLDTVWAKTKGTGMVTQTQIAMCPHCEAFLGFAAFSL